MAGPQEKVPLRGEDSASAFSVRRLRGRPFGALEGAPSPTAQPGMLCHALPPAAAPVLPAAPSRGHRWEGAVMPNMVRGTRRPSVWACTALPPWMGLPVPTCWSGVPVTARWDPAGEDWQCVTGTRTPSHGSAHGGPEQALAQLKCWSQATSSKDKAPRGGWKRRVLLARGKSTPVQQFRRSTAWRKWQIFHHVRPVSREECLLNGQ